MAIVWSNNFDAESEGALPADWHKDSGFTPATLEVDDTKYYSSPHSMLVTKENGGYGYALTDPGVFTITDVTPFSCRFWSDGGGVHWVQTADQDGGDFDYLKTAALILLDDSSGTITGTPYAIGYFNGSAWIDTGHVYNSGAWNLLDWEHDFGNNDFDLWINTVSAGTDLSFRYDQSQVECICIYSDDEAWFDNFQVGEEEGWPGGAPVTAGSLCGVG